MGVEEEQSPAEEEDKNQAEEVDKNPAAQVCSLFLCNYLKQFQFLSSQEY
jgi:hypothetical protein